MNHISTVTASLDYPAFKKAMTNACKIIDRTVTLPILAVVLIRAARGGVQVIGTDHDLYISTFVPGDVTVGFVALVSAHRLKSMMDKVKDTSRINFTVDGAALTVTLGKLNVSLGNTLNVADFPLDQTFRDALGKSNAAFILPAALIEKILFKVAFAISTEETRYYLNGVYMIADDRNGLLTFVATDGHRMARYEVPLPAGAGAMATGVIIPNKAVLELQRLVKRKDRDESVLITTTTTGVSFLVSEDELLESKVIDGTYPDYGRIIPARNDNKVGIPSRKLIDGITQASAILPPQRRAVKMAFSSGRLVLSCSDPEFGTASTEFGTHGNFELTVGCNAGYMLDILGRLDGGAMLEIRDDQSALAIRDGADERVTFVQMPLRV